MSSRRRWCPSSSRTSSAPRRSTSRSRWPRSSSRGYRSASSWASGTRRATTASGRVESSGGSSSTRLATRSFTRQLDAFVIAKSPEDAASYEAYRRATLYRVIAFAQALCKHLQRERDLDELKPLLEPKDPDAGRDELVDFFEEASPPAAILYRLGGDVRTAGEKGWLHSRHAPMLDASIGSLTDVLAGCERIKSTPTPSSVRRRFVTVTDPDHQRDVNPHGAVSHRDDRTADGTVQRQRVGPHDSSRTSGSRFFLVHGGVSEDIGGRAARLRVGLRPLHSVRDPCHRRQSAPRCVRRLGPAAAKLRRAGRPALCQFAASCRHLKPDCCRVMPPRQLQAHAATSTRA